MEMLWSPHKQILAQGTALALSPLLWNTLMDRRFGSSVETTNHVICWDTVANITHPFLDSSLLKAGLVFVRNIKDTLLQPRFVNNLLLYTQFCHGSAHRFLLGIQLKVGGWSTLYT